MINKINLLKNLKIEFDFKTVEKLTIWQKIFEEYNSHTNLMSRKDIEVLFEKHVYDSLSINLWEDFKNKKTILDVGTGGGFPSVILSIFFSDKKIIANDSRIKKINFINEIKEKLRLNNLQILYSRIEEAPKQNADLILSRAVGKIVDIYELSKKHLVSNGNFAIYKSKTVKEEIEIFKNKYKKAEFKIIPYELPLKENFERSLVILENL